MHTLRSKLIVIQRLDFAEGWEVPTDSKWCTNWSSSLNSTGKPQGHTSGHHPNVRIEICELVRVTKSSRELNKLKAQMSEFGL